MGKANLILDIFLAIAFVLCGTLGFYGLLAVFIELLTGGSGQTLPIIRIATIVVLIGISLYAQAKIKTKGIRAAGALVIIFLIILAVVGQFSLDPYQKLPFLKR